SILLKPGKLTPHEFDIMKSHTLIGGNTLQAAEEETGKEGFLAMGRDIAYFHHEKWDGSGYPYGLKEEAIPHAARIVAISDVYDALSSRRPYKEPFAHEKCMAILAEGRGQHFDPDVVDAFVAREKRVLDIRSQFQENGKLASIEQLAVMPA
ncbi:MAG: HD domain-containing phosphohydrolase, partial [Candidatus Hydrogenedentales bacterium]